MQRSTVGAITLLALAMPARAAETSPQAINDLIKMARGDKQLQSMVLGFGKGLEAANLKLEAIGRPTLYCVPGDQTIKSDQYIDIVSGYVQKHPEWGKIDGRILPEVLAQAMMDTYPCE